MSCEHLKSTVTETRRVGADIYRRRACGMCGQFFVSVETAPEGLKMPPEAHGRVKRRERLQAPKPAAWQGWGRGADPN